MIDTTRSSSDMYLVSYVYAMGIQPSMVQTDGRKKIFIFDDPRYEEICTEYYARKGTIEPIAFQNAIRNIKALIYNQ